MGGCCCTCVAVLVVVIVAVRDMRIWRVVSPGIKNDKNASLLDY